MTAVDDVKALFAAKLSAPHDLAHYEGSDWWQLSPAQAEVFGIEIEDMPALVLAWELYEALAEIADNEYHGTDLIRVLQAELSWIEQRACSPQQWQRFASLLGIRTGRAFQWFWKNHFEHENTWVLPREDDHLPMPRAVLRNGPPPSPADDDDDSLPF